LERADETGPTKDQKAQGYGGFIGFGFRRAGLRREGASARRQNESGGRSGSGQLEKISSARWHRNV
jgi:hypothetical protein